MTTSGATRLVNGGETPAGKRTGRLGPPVRIVADPRKFSEYALVPGHVTGKDGVFIDLLGYRPRSADDASVLAATYIEQATQRWAAGEAAFTREDDHGRFYVILIELRGVRLRTVWNHRPNGELALVTPFRGFAK